LPRLHFSSHFFLKFWTSSYFCSPLFGWGGFELESHIGTGLKSSRCARAWWQLHAFSCPDSLLSLLIMTKGVGERAPLGGGRTCYLSGSFLSLLPTSLLSFPHLLLLASSAADYSLSHQGALLSSQNTSVCGSSFANQGQFEGRWACVFSLSLSLVLRQLDIFGFVFSDAGSGLGPRCVFVHFMCRRVLDCITAF
jgi:hypothetical protein